jgi:hypothetical protein
MQRVTLKIAAAVMLLLAVQVALAQTPMAPTAPGTSGDPRWQARIRMDDGRTFVTDGGFVIDAGLARPATLPEREIPGKVMLDYFKAPYTDECSLSDLRAASERYFVTPSGIALSSTYVNYLRRTLPSRLTRLRMTLPGQPLLIVVDGKPVGVLMPVKQPTDSAR